MFSQFKKKSLFQCRQKQSKTKQPTNPQNHCVVCLLKTVVNSLGTSGPESRPQQRGGTDYSRQKGGGLSPDPTEVRGRGQTLARERDSVQRPAEVKACVEYPPQKYSPYEEHSGLSLVCQAIAFLRGGSQEACYPSLHESYAN